MANIEEIPEKNPEPKQIVKCTAWCMNNLETLSEVCLPSVAADQTFVGVYNEIQKGIQQGDVGYKQRINNSVFRMATMGLVETKDDEDMVVKYHITQYLQSVETARLHLLAAVERSQLTRPEIKVSASQ